MFNHRTESDMLTAQTPPAWHIPARLRLTRLQAEAEAASENSKATEREANTLNSRLNDLRPMLRTAEEARAVIQRANLPADDARAIKAQQAVDALRAEIEATTRAIEDARLRYTEISKASNCRIRLAYDAKQALRACGVSGV